MRSLKTVANELAIAHRKADPETTIIKFFPTTSPSEVRLLEVSSAAPTTGEILPFRFAADIKNRVEFPSIVILVSPSEWQDIQTHRLGLPEGWDLQNAEDI
jgi:hypothetical protein